MSVSIADGTTPPDGMEGMHSGPIGHCFFHQVRDYSGTVYNWVLERADLTVYDYDAPFPGPISNVCEPYGDYLCDVGANAQVDGFSPYFQNALADTITCDEDFHCGSYDAKLWSAYGSVRGRAVFPDGTAVPPDVTIVAHDPLRIFSDVRVQTGFDGFFDFTQTIAPTFNGFVTFPSDNNWGLAVLGDGKGYDPAWARTFLTKLAFMKRFSSSRGAYLWFFSVAGAKPKYVLPVVVSGAELITITLPAPPTIPRPDQEDPDDRPDKDCDPGADSDCDPKCDGDDAPGGAGAPVRLTNGNVYLDQMDAVIPGLRTPIILRRSYNSEVAAGKPISPQYWGAGSFGPGWFHPYDSSITALSPGVLRLRHPDGTSHYFTNPTATSGGTPFSPLLGRRDRSKIFKEADGSYSWRFRSGGVMLYDSAGRLSKRRDAAGIEQTLTYDGEGRLASIADQGGRTVTFGYHPLYRRQVTSILGPEGPIANYSYTDDGIGNALLTQVTYPDGSGFQYSYTRNGFFKGLLTEVRDLEGKILERHDYVDGKGVTSERGGGQEKLTFAYEDGKTTVTDALGNATVYEWTEIAGLKLVTQATGPCSSCGGGGSESQQWAYDDAGHLLTHTLADDTTRTFTYFPDGSVESITDQLNHTTSHTYDDRGRIATASKPDGGYVERTYLSAGVHTIKERVSATQNRLTTIDYNSIGKPQTITDPRGKVTTLGYNTFGDLTSITDPLGYPNIPGHTSAMDYYPSGRLKSVTTALAHTTSYAYDAVGRLTGVTRPDTAHTGFTYDKGGRLRTITDPLGRTTTLVYDAYGRLDSVVDAKNGTTRYTYDAMSNLVSVTDPAGHSTTFDRDAFRRVTRMTYPGGASETYSYDHLGRLASRVDRKNVETRFTYYDDGNLRLREYFGGPATPSVSYTYDAVGRLQSVANGTDTVSWTYDLSGAALTETSTKNAFTVSFGYDEAGNRSTLRVNDPAGAAPPFASYSFDDAGRLQYLYRGQLGSAQFFQFGYDNASRRTSLSFPNGTATTYDRDPNSRLTSVRTAFGATTIAAAAHTYDRAGNRATRTTPDFGETYSYDELDRLVKVDRAGPAPALWRYGYDAVGNRVSEESAGGVLHLSYDNGNRLNSRDGGGPVRWRGVLSELGNVTLASATVNGLPARILPGNVFEATLDLPPGPATVTVRAVDLKGNARTNTYQVQIPSSVATYTYDANGNVETVTTSGNTRRYEWSTENRLLRVCAGSTCTGSNDIVRYAYDGLGRRVEKISGGVTVGYAYDGHNLLRESDSAGSRRTYFNTFLIDEPLAHEDAGGQMSYYHADALGSILAVTNPAAAATYTRQTDAFGNPEIGASQASFAFAGREWDPESGLYYYRARYYDPNIGRFISEDPKGLSAGANLFGYALGNPTTNLDPFGWDVTVTLYAWGADIGHVGIGVNSDTTLGFYPKQHDLDLYLGKDVAGELRTDEGDVVDSFVIHTTPEQDAALNNILDAVRRDAPMYNFLTHGCAVAAADELRAAGIPVPDSSLPNRIPTIFFRNLQKQYGGANR
jgi:RHS repeat-associated protein